MKKLILLLILLPSLCVAQEWQEARMNPYVAGSVVSAAGGDTCTGTKLFAAHFENNDDVTQGTPAGCVVSGGDNTLTRTNTVYSATQYTDGAYSIYANGDNHNAQITPTNMTGLETTGTYCVNSYHTRETGTSRVFSFTDGSTTVLGLITYNAGGNTITTNHSGNTVTSTATFSNSSWTRLCFSWDSSPGDGAEKIAVKVGASAWKELTDRNLTEIGTLTTMYIIGGFWQFNVGYYDQLKIYNTYKATE